LPLYCWRPVTGLCADYPSGRITQRRQLFHGQQNLNVMFRESGQNQPRVNRRLISPVTMRAAPKTAIKIHAGDVSLLIVCSIGAN